MNSWTLQIVVPSNLRDPIEISLGGVRPLLEWVRASAGNLEGLDGLWTRECISSLGRLHPPSRAMMTWRTVRQIITYADAMVTRPYCEQPVLAYQMAMERVSSQSLEQEEFTRRNDIVNRLMKLFDSCQLGALETSREFVVSVVMFLLHRPEVNSIALCPNGQFHENGVPVNFPVADVVSSDYWSGRFEKFCLRQDISFNTFQTDVSDVEMSELFIILMECVNGGSCSLSGVRESVFYYSAAWAKWLNPTIHWHLTDWKLPRSIRKVVDSCGGAVCNCGGGYSHTVVFTGVDGERHAENHRLILPVTLQSPVSVVALKPLGASEMVLAQLRAQNTKTRLLYAVATLLACLACLVVCGWPFDSWAGSLGGLTVACLATFMVFLTWIKRCIRFYKENWNSKASAKKFGVFWVTKLRAPAINDATVHVGKTGLLLREATHHQMLLLGYNTGKLSSIHRSMVAVLIKDATLQGITRSKGDLELILRHYTDSVKNTPEKWWSLPGVRNATSNSLSLPKVAAVGLVGVFAFHALSGVTSVDTLGEVDDVDHRQRFNPISLIADGIPELDRPPHAYAGTIENERLAIANRIMLQQARLVSMKFPAWRQVGNFLAGVNFGNVTPLTFEEMYDRNVDRGVDYVRRLQAAEVALLDNPGRDLKVYYSTFVKQELGASDAKDPRVISAPTWEVKLVVGAWLAKIGKRVASVWDYTNDVTYASGMDPWQHGLWLEDCYRKLGDDIVFLEVDFSRWDAHLCKEALDVEADVYERMGMNGSAIAAIRRSAGWTKAYGKRGTVADVYATRKSGDPNTSTGNSLLNGALNALILDEIFGKGNYKLIVLGDDMLAAIRADVAHRWDESRYTQFAEDLNLEPEYIFHDDPSTAVYKASFCSQLFWPCDYRGEPRWFLGPKPARQLTKWGYQIGVRNKNSRSKLRGMVIGALPQGEVVPGMKPYYQRFIGLQLDNPLWLYVAKHFQYDIQTDRALWETLPGLCERNSATEQACFVRFGMSCEEVDSYAWTQRQAFVDEFGGSM